MLKDEGKMNISALRWQDNTLKLINLQLGVKYEKVKIQFVDTKPTHNLIG